MKGTPKKGDSLPGLGWLISHVASVKGSMIMTLGIIVLEVACSISLTGIQKWMIDDVFIDKNYTLLMPIVCFFISIIALYSIVVIIRPVCTERINVRLNQKLSLKLYQHLTKLPMLELQNNRTAGYVNNFTSDIVQIANLVSNDLPRVGQLLLNTLVLAVIVGWANLYILLFVLAFSSIYLWIGKYYALKLRSLSKEVQEKRSDFLVQIEEGISASREVLMYNRNQWEIGRLNRAFEKFLSKKIDEVDLLNRQFIRTEPLRWGISMLVLTVGGWEIMRSSLSIGMFVIIYQFTSQLSGRCQELFQATLEVTRKFSYIDRFQSLISGYESKELEGSGLDGNIRRIRFENVTFQYPSSGDRVLTSLHLDIPVGKKIAFVGTSGGGKSTVAFLLIRFLEVTKGRILVNDGDIRSISHENWVSRCSIVFQEPYFFDDSIYTNLTLGRAGICSGYVQEVCAKMQIHSLILSLPDGYDTIIGERGVTLSGGQRQRLALVRALLSNPEILILDEATSALDIETERQIQKNLDEIRRNKTTIIIAHRLSTIENADRIYVLDNGEIVEEGTHQSLIRNGNVYARLTARGVHDGAR